jgi:glycosyltransferase involved in cell wall biosynthesis
MVLESIANQVYKNIEVILINDASKDNTLKIYKDFSRNFKNVFIINNKKNKERCESRNIGIRASKGKYIAIVDDDDILLPERISKTVKFLEENPDFYLISSRASMSDIEGKKLGLSYGGRNLVTLRPKILLNKNVVVHSSITFRNTKEYWYRHEMSSAEDYDLYLQILSDSKKIGILPDILVEYLSWSSDSSEYRYKQIMLADIARTFYNQRVRRGSDDYKDFKQGKIEEFLSKKAKLQLEIERTYWNRKYLKTIKLETKMFFMYGLSKKNIFYLGDSLVRGLLRKRILQN